MLDLLCIPSIKLNHSRIMSVVNKCLCCLAWKCTKDIFTEYNYNGQKEVYSDLLFNTLDIYVPQDSSSCKICDQCVIELRRAAEFKKKVLNTRDHLKLEQLPHDDFDDCISVDFDHEDTKLVVGEVNGKGQTFVIQTISKTNLSGADAKSPAPDEKDVMIIEDSVEFEPSRLVQNENIKEEHHKDRKIKQPESQNQKDLKQNSLNLIFNSNLCLFKSLKTKFGCFVCEKAYFTIQELRQHFKVHLCIKEEIIETKFNRMRGLSTHNADISSLICINCEEACSDLTELKKHLIEKHGIAFGNAEHLLIPYKLENSFDCVVCNEKFNTYMTLSVHMNQHYSNNVCEVCGNSYINRISLRIHLQSRHKEKKCSLCSETFLTTYARVRHMRTHHNSGLSKRYCLICGRTFRYTYQLEEHKIQEHGAKRQLSKCSLCPKTFPNTQNLKIHVRSVHVKERNFPCHICDMRFFTKFDQKRHEKTHDDFRSHVCSFCESKFKGKDSLRRHLKRQHGQVTV